MPKFIIDDHLYDKIQENCPEISPRIIPFSSGLQTPVLDKKAIILEEEDFFYISLKEIKLDHVSYCGEMSESKINDIEQLFNKANVLYFAIQNELLLYQQLSITIPLLEELKNKQNHIYGNLHNIDDSINFGKSFVCEYQTKIDEYLKLSNDVYACIFDNVKFGILGERIYE